MSTSSVASDGRPTSSGSNKDRASTPTRQSSPGSANSASKPGGLIKAFGTLRIDGKDAPSSPKIADLMERSESTSVPNPADVQVTDPIREKAVATKKYLRKKYEERARNEELAFQRRKAFEVRRELRLLLWCLTCPVVLLLFSARCGLMCCPSLPFDSRVLYRAAFPRYNRTGAISVGCSLHAGLFLFFFWQGGAGQPEHHRG